MPVQKNMLRLGSAQVAVWVGVILCLFLYCSFNNDTSSLDFLSKNEWKTSKIFFYGKNKFDSIIPSKRIYTMRFINSKSKKYKIDKEQYINHRGILEIIGD